MVTPERRLRVWHEARYLRACADLISHAMKAATVSANNAVVQGIVDTDTRWFVREALNAAWWVKRARPSSNADQGWEPLQP